MKAIDLMRELLALSPDDLNLEIAVCTPSEEMVSFEFLVRKGHRPERLALTAPVDGTPAVDLRAKLQGISEQAEMALEALEGRAPGTASEHLQQIVALTA
jgi:hypothetical protein